MKKTIAIIGGGPAGCTIAILLQRQGQKVGMFNDSKKLDLFVGESLTPALVPILKELGIEEDVKKESVVKKGVTVWLDEKIHADASFENGLGGLPSYSYNTNRKELDTLLLKTAIDSGVRLFDFRAEVSTEGDRVLLSKSTLEKCGDYFKNQPDLVVDASGRRRVLSEALKLPTERGIRSDTALFVHVKERDFPENYGNLHMHLATKGWAWRIPLANRTSVGIVVNKEKLNSHGASLEEQFDNYVAQDKKLKPFFENCKRISEIQKFSNYQLTSKRIVGENWVLIGDSAGFLDPIFSSGLHMAMKYAFELSKVLDESTTNSYISFEKTWKCELNSWKKMTKLWYNGRLFTNFLSGNDRSHTFFGKRLGKHAIKHFTAVFTGEAVLNRYSMWLLGFMTGPLLDFMYYTRMHSYKVKDLEL